MHKNRAATPLFLLSCVLLSCVLVLGCNDPATSPPQDARAPDQSAADLSWPDAAREASPDTSVLDASWPDQTPPPLSSWVIAAGGKSLEDCNGIGVDGAGNTYVTGDFLDSTTFGSKVLTSGGGYDLFVAKLSPAGKHLWAVSTGSTGDEFARGIAVDGYGTSTITGDFSGTVSFGTQTLSSKGPFADIYVARLDAKGNYLWAAAASVPTTGYIYAYAVAVDSAGNSYITGEYDEKATFGTTTLTPSGPFPYPDVFVAKLDPKGKWLWARTAGGKGQDHARGVAVDGAGNVVVVGYSGGSATFGSQVLVPQGKYDLFVAKLDSAGKWLWAKSGGGKDDDHARSVAVDGSGNAYIAGEFYGSATFGGKTYTAAGAADVFVAKLDSKGDVAWFASAGSSSGFEAAYGVAVGQDGKVHATGYFGSFSTTATFGTVTLTTKGSLDIFVARLGPTGQWLGATSAGGDHNDQGRVIAVDAVGNSYAGGFFQSKPTTFGSTTFSASGSRDIFVWKHASGSP